MATMTQKAGNGVTVARRIIPDLAQQEALELAALRAERDRLIAENAALAAKARGPAFKLKVGEKGGVSLYGMGRFPVTLYAGQWDKLFAYQNEIKAFIKANQHLLSEKA